MNFNSKSILTSMTLVIYDLNSILDLLVQFIISISKQALIN